MWSKQEIVMSIQLTALCLFLYYGPHSVYAQCSGSPLSIEVGYKSQRLKFPEAGEYGINLTCQWLITSTVSAQILYKSVDIQIDCSDSYSIYDGSNSISPSKESDICTTGLPISKSLDRSSGQNLFLRFISDGRAAAGKDNGFTVYFVSASDLSSCPSSGSTTILIASDIPQAFTSPNFPNNYLMNWQCDWSIRASTSSRAVVLFLYYIDIDTDSNGSCYDKLTIHHGTKTDEVCGDENFSPSKTYTNGGSGNISVIFTSDGVQVESGFVAVYIEKGF